jgi:hypothetical protein
MADNKKSVNLLPEYLRSDKNSKFLSSTIDQLIQTPQLERINGYVGSKITPNYNPATDVYITENFSLRKDYQLEPALVFKNSADTITDVVGYADLINELSIQGSKTDNHDRLLRSKFYSYDPMINWDALVNYSEYYWLPTGPEIILINNSLSPVLDEIIGQPSYQMDNGYNLSNGMKLVFTDSYTAGAVSIIANREYIVEGVGSAITLVDFNLLDVSEALSVSYNETFDSDSFDSFPFDGDKKLPITPEYITINRSSVDLNPWSRYNRWFHSDVIKITAEINNLVPSYPVSAKAQRPIIEFKPNIQLYNFGQTGIQNIDLVDTDTRDPFTQVHGTTGYYIDQVLLEEGQRITFNAADDELVKGNIYRVSFTIGSSPVIQLQLDTTPNDRDSVSVNLGKEFSGKSFYFDEVSKVWKLAQQHAVLNEAPLFDLFDTAGTSFSAEPGINDFAGSKIFGYDIGTGAPDNVLGFPLKYQSSVGIGSYLFKNYFMTDIITVTVNNQSSEITTSAGYLKINRPDSSPLLVNVWQTADTYKIPVIEQRTIRESTATLTITSLDTPVSTNTSVISFVNGVRVNPTVTIGNKITVNFTNTNDTLKINDFVQFNITTDQSPNSNGYYEPALSLTNNPLNGPISDMTLSELSDHLGTMIPKISDFNGSFPGKSNLRDLTDYTKYGTRLISNANPIAYAQIFLGKKEHNLVDAIRLASNQYNQFKMNLLRSIVTVDSQLTPADALDYVLKFINKDKDNKSPYYRSDMLAYGSDVTVKEYTVGIVPNYVYAIGMEYNPTALSFKSVLVYRNDSQLTLGIDYELDSIDGTITILSTLVPNDVIKVCTYDDTLGAFVPATPSKLGLYPSYAPEIYTDNSYVGGPVTMIRGHDGSIIRAYGDYRDAIVLEYEKRIFNNIKVTYNPALFDVSSILPGAFRNSQYSYAEANDILISDFVKWAGAYGVDISSHSVFDDNNGFTYNYKGSVDTVFGQPVSGSWRNIYNYFYDTDRPNTHPWEMLGYSVEPTWWSTHYGVGPFTSANTLMWTDLRDGFSRGTSTYNTDYARPELLSIVPVDALGNLKSPDEFLVTPSTYANKQALWVAGDQGPAESAWRNSSYWPFAVNVLSALLQPCNYAASMYDVSRTSLNQNDQLVYEGDIYLNPQNIVIEGDQDAQTAGYGVYVIEKGNQTDLDYVSKFKQDIDYLNFNLFYKVGGFTSKDKLQVIIDAIDPSTQSQSAILPPEDYSLILNVSNPVKSVRISGVIVQRSNGKFVVKGYDRTNPYFEILKPIKSSVSGAVTVGGKSAPFTEWSNVVNNGATGLSSVDTTTAESNTTRYYKQGQIVRYNNIFYRVKVGHTAQAVFDPSLFQQLPGLPVTGGASAALPAKFEAVSTQVPYGTEYSTIQEVYDLLVGYGAFLESQGFVFDEYNTELFEILNWAFTGKEFLFWTTQAWADDNLITLSPFAGTLKYQFTDSIVDNISTGKYEYSLLKADGKSFPIKNFRLTRNDGVCTISTVDTEEGFFFATLNLVQKEHAMVFNNSTIFSDTIYDIETGYRQSRMKVSGFRTANWNGDFFSPGFVFDNVEVSDWKSYQIYNPGKVVRYNGAYYESTEKINGDKSFEFNKWVKLPGKPVPELLPNFDYKISQFEDFYSLDIDNFDSAQQQLSQQLLGYNQRPYLTNIFTNPTTQYKFYQGFIRDKGTKNALDKIAKVGAFTRNGDIEFKEEWAFRVGHYGGYETYKEIEFTLDEGTSLENPYLVKFVDSIESNPNSLINYIPSSDMLIKPDDYISSTTFNTYSSTDYDDTNFELSTAGYVNIDDVTATAYNKNSLLDIANNSSISQGNTIWLGFLEDGGWAVYRYARQSAKISGVFVDAPAESITFVTDIHHGLSAGDVVSIVAFNDQVNGVYIVKSTPELNQFTVASELSTIVNEELLAFGALFKFDNARYAGFKELSEVKNLLNLSAGDKLWIDRDSSNKWAVYEKTKNYNTGIAANTYAAPSGQELGHTVFANDDSNVIMVSAPSWQSAQSGSVGKVWVYDTSFDNFVKKYEYILNTNNKIYAEANTGTEFGYSLGYDNNKELYFAGAPASSNVRVDTVGTVVYSTGTGAARTFESEGLVKISSRASFFGEEKTERVLARPNNDATPAGFARFGHSVYTNQVAVTSATTVLVSAPGDGDVHNSIGHVYAYHLTTATLSVNLVAHPEGIEVLPTLSSSKMQWGYNIAGDAAGNFIAITAPGYIGAGKGFVEIFDNTLTSKQVIQSPFGASEIFGNDVFVSDSGKFLLVSSTNTKTVGEGYGKVAIYKANNLTSTGTYTLHQIIANPVLTNDLKFGHSISLSKDETVLVVSSLGKNRSQYYAFDEASRTGVTTFDQNTTRFVAPIVDAGAAYVYNNLGDYFVPAEELNDAAIIEGSRYGYSVAATNDYVLVGAPWYSTSSADDDSTFFKFDKIDKTTNSFKLLQSQPDLVDANKVKRIVLINSVNEEIVEYLDVFDPLKGRIPGLAGQELKYRVAADPAVYTIGTAGTVVDTETSWIDEHVGELWWDLSTLKYTWYEQGNEIFRKNNWGKLFPGSTVDVYEWVKSDLLPSEWAAQADTNEGLTQGISGQPKYPDNSIVSVKQLFNNVTNSFENVYYYWVKNKVTVPAVPNRRISSFQVASLIADPAANGLKFAEIIAPNAIALANVQPMLVGSNINANIAIDSIDNKIPRHTEWLLLEEGSAISMPTTLLNKKLFDSLLGHDVNGTLVPDLNLSYRNKYGIGIRPQQTLFRDRLEALRNIVEFSNSVLIKNRITGSYNFNNLNKKEEIPDQFSNEYDLVVEDLFELDLVDTTNFIRAEVECTTFNGRIIEVNIINPGYGYNLPPEILIFSETGSGAIITTGINSNGELTSATIKNAGANYTELSPTTAVRPHTVIVSVNEEYNNRWTKHVFDYTFRTWIRIKTQSYNTSLYWKYVDWVSDSYNGYKDYKYVISDSSELSKITDTVSGDYVKINNIGDGRYVILEKVQLGSVGNFSTSYNVVYSQRGTIQILDDIWNYLESNYAYDISTLEETLYDQIPDLELFNILTALKDDLFVRDLKVNWNLLFFKAVKYALTEQKLLDWAFKTSFITINNKIGDLDQRSVYRLDNESYFEEYINEVKPYRTKIRSYTSSYTVNDVFGSSGSPVTDFDLPSYYNSLTNVFEQVGLDNPLITENPWKWWAENYKYYVSTIEVADSGDGYTQRPSVQLITAPGDTGSGASAEAYIRDGKLHKILVTSPGSGYVTAPILSITGGGPLVTSPATASVIMANDFIRKNKVNIKFDRVGTRSEIGDVEVTETFECSGVDNKFTLGWLAEPAKSHIIPLLDNKLVFSADYTIEYFTETVNNRTRKHCRFVFLNYVPLLGQKFKITYNKNIDLYSAVDRIEGYYEPTDSMPGKELPLLMTGAEQGGTQIQGLSFGYSPPWDQGFFDNDSAWSDSVEYYASAKLTSNAIYTTSTLQLNSTAGISVGQRVNVVNTSTKYIRDNTVVTAVNTTLNTIVLSNKTYIIDRVFASSSTNEYPVVFSTVENLSYLQENDRVVISLDNGTITGYDGDYIVTGVGNKRFEATAITPTVLSTTTVTTVPSSSTVYVPSLLANINAVSDYKIYQFVDDVISTGTVYYDTQVPVSLVSSVKIMLGTNELSTSPGPVEYYEVIPTSNNTFAFTVYNLGENTLNQFDVTVYGYPTVEFWRDSFNVGGVDTELIGGSWNGSGNFVGALGVNPADIIVNSGQLIDVNFGYAPEEHVKGHVLESININVYTQDDQTSPLVVTGVVPVEAFKTTVAKLSLPVDESVGVMVTYKSKIFDRLESPPPIENTGPNFSVDLAEPVGPEGPPIASTAGDDYYTGPYTIPFNWNMFGTIFTEVYVSTNGYLTFGGPGNNFSAPFLLGDVDSVSYPAIFVQYCDLWQDFGPGGQSLSTGGTPGLYISSGTVGIFNYWRLRFQGSHYDQRNLNPMPAYEYEVTLYSDGTNQYVEMVYENTWRNQAALDPVGALGFFTGIATANLNEFVQVPYTDIDNNTSHVFYSTQSGGQWQYAGQGSFDPFKDPYTFSAQNQYYIQGDSIFIAPQPESGRASYTLMTMGGENVIDSNSVLVDDPAKTSILVDSIANINDVRSVYVTADGVELMAVESTSSYGYMVTPVGSNNNRAAITVYNIPDVPTTIQAWFLKSNHPEFNGMWEETFVIGTTATSTLELTKPISNIEPVSAQVFVEIDTLSSTGVKGRRRLMPPDVTYYKVENDQTVYNIDTKPRPSDTFALSNVRVYGNGALLRPGFDYIPNFPAGTITLSPGLLPSGSAIAIEILINYDYVVSGNTVFLTNEISENSIKVTTFTDHTGMMIRTERFDGNGTRRFVLSLPAISSQYIWAYVDGAPLIAGYDYELLEDMRTVQFSEWTGITPFTEVTISVVNSPFRSNMIVGYNISKDIFERNSYNRITDFYSTKLTKELSLTDTEIHVADSTRLIPPNPGKNVPGVVFVDGERIEFFSRASNVLGDLRRSTMGTGPASFSEIGTLLLDRSPQQRMPYADILKVQKHITTSTTDNFVLNTVTGNNNTYTVKISTSSYVVNTGTLFESTGTGMTLANIDGLSNQLTVKYGGRVLRKNTGTVHNPNLSYDSSAESVYTIPPEFTVSYNQGTGNYEVNITVDDFRIGTRIDIEQRTGTVWQTPGDSILIADTIQAEFLRAKTTNLPDSYYYGGNPVLTDDANFELTDEDNNPLEGY